MKSTPPSLEVVNNDGDTFLFSILIKEDLGKFQFIILNIKKNSQKIFKKSKSALKYLLKRKIVAKDINKLVEFCNQHLRLREIESRAISTLLGSYERSLNMQKKGH